MNLETFRSFEGRIGRSTWWLASIIIWLVQAIAYGLANSAGLLAIDPNHPVAAGSVMTFTGLVVLAILLIALWATLAVYAKRWHDRGKSGWWTLIVLIPVIGGLWALIELGFLKGDAGPNRFGPDPLVA